MFSGLPGAKSKDRQEARGKQGAASKVVKWYVFGGQVVAYVGAKRLKIGPLEEMLTVKGLAAFLRAHQGPKFTWLTRTALADLLDLLASPDPSKPPVVKRLPPGPIKS